MIPKGRQMGRNIRELITKYYPRSKTEIIRPNSICRKEVRVTATRQARNVEV